MDATIVSPPSCPELVAVEIAIATAHPPVLVATPGSAEARRHQLEARVARMRTIALDHIRAMKEILGPHGWAEARDRQRGP